MTLFGDLLSLAGKIAEQGVGTVRRIVRAGRDRIGGAPFAQPVGEPLIRQGACVVAWHLQARRIGEDVLAAGGNAFDAFVATVAAENVLAEGASSLAGPLGVLVHCARNGRTEYLDADFNDPLDPEAVCTAARPEVAGAVLVPGAPAGLAALAERCGTLPLATLLAPAANLAEAGFRVNNLMASYVAQRAGVLKATDYGRHTYFPGGRALRPGDTLRLPQMAAFLRALGEAGPAHVHAGPWGERFLAAAAEAGCRLTADDLAAYRVRWCEPWEAAYRGKTLRSSSGRSYGGLWGLLALRAHEILDPPKSPHYAEDPEALALMIRLARHAWSETFLFDAMPGGNDPAVELEERAHAIARKARGGEPPLLGPTASGHSYHVIVRDAAGNIASGTTTIEADPWGDGVFVEGVPLTTAGRLPLGTEPGQRRLSPFSIHIAFEGGRPVLSVGAISNSVVEAAFQLLVNLLHHGMSLRDAVAAPRFGTFPARKVSGAGLLDLDRNWLDPRIGRETVAGLEDRDLRVVQRGIVDTGLGTLLSLRPDGTVEGITSPVPYVRDPFGYAPARQKAG